MAIIKRGGWTFNDNFGLLERAIVEGAAKIVDDTAVSIRKDARRRAPVDTTALRESAAVRSPLRDETEAARASVKAANLKAELDDPISLENFDDDIAVAVVDVMVTYASFLEMGHYSAFIGVYAKPQPFLGPAVRFNKEDFEARVTNYLKQIGIIASK